MRRAQATLIVTVLLAVAVVMISIVLYMAYVKTKSQILEQPVVETEEQALESLILVKNITIKHGKTTIELSHPAPTRILVLCYNSSSVKEFPIPPGLKTITIPRIGTRGYDIIIPTAEGHRVIHIIPAEVAVQENKLKLETYITSSVNYARIIGSYRILIESSRHCNCKHCYCKCLKNHCLCFRSVTLGELYQNYTNLNETIVTTYELNRSLILQEHFIALPNTLITRNNEILLNYSTRIVANNIKCKLVAGRKYICTILRGPYVTGAVYNCTITKTVLYNNITVIVCVGDTCIRLNSTVIPIIDLNSTPVWSNSRKHGNIRLIENHYEIRISSSGGEGNRIASIMFNVTSLRISARSLIIGIVNVHDDKFATIRVKCKCCMHKCGYKYSITLQVTVCKTSNFSHCKSLSRPLVTIKLFPGCGRGHHRGYCYISIIPATIVLLKSREYIKYVKLEYSISPISNKSPRWYNYDPRCSCINVHDYLYDVVIVPLPVELNSR